MVDEITPTAIPSLGVIETKTSNFGGHPHEFWAERLQIPCFTPRYALQYIGTDILREHFH